MPVYMRTFEGGNIILVVDYSIPLSTRERALDNLMVGFKSLDQALKSMDKLSDRFVLRWITKNEKSRQHVREIASRMTVGMGNVQLSETENTISISRGALIIEA